MYTDQREIAPGTTVYDATGEKIGTVLEQSVDGGYLMVEKGWLFTKDFYVPVNLIGRVDADGAYLTITKADLTDPRFEQPPVTGSAPAAAAASAATVTDAADLRIPVREEELVAGTQETEAGRVRIHKDVVTEQQTLSVPVQKERVTVERVPLSGEVTASEDAFVERDLEIPVMGETVVTGKRVVGVEEVRVHKDSVTEQQQITDTVRKEQVTIDQATQEGETLLDDETRRPSSR
jgi:uncharacterized protein (TIGR02271 family)